MNWRSTSMGHLFSHVSFSPTPSGSFYRRYIFDLIVPFQSIRFQCNPEIQNKRFFYIFLNDPTYPTVSKQELIF